MATKTAKKTNGRDKADPEELAMRAKAVLDEGIAEMQAAAEQLSDTAQKQVRDVSGKTTKYVSDNPGKALLGALGVGVLVGMALKSR